MTRRIAQGTPCDQHQELGAQRLFTSHRPVANADREKEYLVLGPGSPRAPGGTKWNLGTFSSLCPTGALTATAECGMMAQLGQPRQP